MKIYPRLKELFDLHDFQEAQHADLNFSISSKSSDADDNLKLNNDRVRWRKIKFDNAIRTLIALPTYLACVVFWLLDITESITPITLVFATYGVIHFSANWIFFGTKHGKKCDFIFSIFDLTTMSFAIYFTGGTESPLYFLYFIPLIVHAFHRDLTLVLSSGFGGVFGYGAAVLISLKEPTLSSLTNLSAQLFFMLLTITVACLALVLLKNRESADRARIKRLKNLTMVTRELLHVVTLTDFPEVSINIIPFINDGLGDNKNFWSRIFLNIKNEGTLIAHAKRGEERPAYSQELLAYRCPVMTSGNKFLFESNSNSPECPTESFSFGAHMCVPIRGTDQETYGVLFSGSTESNRFGVDEIQFLEFVAKSLGLSIQRLFRLEELKKSLEMNSGVMAANIASTRSITETYDTLLEGFMNFLKADHATLMLWDKNEGALQTIRHRGPVSNEEKELTVQLGEGVPGKALEEGEPCFITNNRNIFGPDRHFGIKSFLSVPLKSVKGYPLGVINAAKTNIAEVFSPIEIDMASTFGMRAALAIENALLHESSRAKLGEQEKNQIQKAA